MTVNLQQRCPKKPNNSKCIRETLILANLNRILNKNGMDFITY